MIDNRVVLPAPLGPMIATSSPGCTSKETSRSASRSPKRLRRPVAPSATGAVASAEAAVSGVAMYA